MTDQEFKNYHEAKEREREEEQKRGFNYSAAVEAERAAHVAANKDFNAYISEIGRKNRERDDYFTFGFEEVAKQIDAEHKEQTEEEIAAAKAEAERSIYEKARNERFTSWNAPDAYRGFQKLAKDLFSDD